MVKMTFPENENIQGLRAYSPTQPSDLEKFEVVHSALDPKARIEQVEAVNLDELPGIYFVFMLPSKYCIDIITL